MAPGRQKFFTSPEDGSVTQSGLCLRAGRQQLPHFLPAKSEILTLDARLLGEFPCRHASEASPDVVSSQMQRAHYSFMNFYNI